MKTNECIKAALQELDAAGIRDVTHAHGGKHWQIRWLANGKERMFTLPVTPSDNRAEANARADIRRMLRDDGLLVDRPKPVRLQPPSLQEEVRWLKAEVRSLRDRVVKLENGAPSTTTHDQVWPEIEKTDEESVA